MTKINQEEYEMLKGLDDKWKWIAGDGFMGIVNVYEDKPRKIGLVKEWTPMGDRANKTITKGNLFQFIQWEGEGPYSIAELIEEYEEYLRTPVAPKFFINGVEHLFENEGEETEVKKNIEWAKKEIKKIHTLTFDAYEAAVIANNKHFQMKNSEQLAFINKVLEILDQLDEPEVLSDKWIDEREQMVVLMNKGRDDFGNVYSAGTMVKGVPSGKLENLLVPKQEEVDRAYKDGYEKGKQHTFYKGYLEGLADKENEPETVADVVTTFWKSFERLKEVMSMEVKELEE